MERIWKLPQRTGSAYAVAQQSVFKMQWWYMWNTFYFIVSWWDEKQLVWLLIYRMTLVTNHSVILWICQCMLTSWVSWNLPAEHYFLSENISIAFLMVTHFLWHTWSRRGESKIKTELKVELFSTTVMGWQQLLMSVVPAPFVVVS